jgi:hypothetical protein
MSRAHSFAVLGVVLLVVLGAGAGPASAQPKAAPSKHAMLVGCTTYPNGNAPPLVGPGNDMKLWYATLTKNFGFPEANIIKLVGWEQDESTRPTLANIQKGFEKLIAVAEPDSQIFICLGGHGTQVPVLGDPLDPKNFEPDGLDEVFLPADTRRADKDGQIPNALKDNDVGDYLDRLRDKGAHVFIVFDCCHSGTMTRATPGANPRIVTRVASPEALGISRKQLDDSIERAKKAVEEREKQTGMKVTEPPKIRPRGAKVQGSLVAFYGAQSFEEAIELPLPEDRPQKSEYYHGLLSFSLNTTLQQRQAPLTYADLTQILASQCRVVVGTAGPVPYAEGDLDREVFGYNVWPKAQDILLTKDGEKLSVSAGSLRGITPGSVLAVHPPANDARDPKTVLGYVKVLDTNVATSGVEPVEYEKTAAVDLKAIPDLARCTVAARDYGDMRVKVFVQDHPGLKAAFKALGDSDDGKEVLAMLRMMEKDTEADWVLRVATPKQVEEEFGVKALASARGDVAFLTPAQMQDKDATRGLKEASKDLVLLVRAPGRTNEQGDVQAADKLLTATGKSPPRRLYGGYQLGDPAALAEDAAELSKAFTRDLPKIFRWQNLWRVAADTANAQGKNYGATLEITRHATEKAMGRGEVLRGAVPNKSYLDIEIKNGNQENVWVVPMYLGPQLEIVSYGKPIALRSGESTKLLRGHVNAKPGEVGTAGLVVFILPQSVFREAPNFKFIEQSGLRTAPTASRAVSRGAAPKTPFGELMKSSVVGDGVPRTRNLTPTVETTPGVLSGSWVIVP